MDVLPVILLVFPARGPQLTLLVCLAAVLRIIASLMQLQVCVTAWKDTTNLQDGLITTTTIFISEFLVSRASTLARLAPPVLLVSLAMLLSFAPWHHQDSAPV